MPRFYLAGSKKSLTTKWRTCFAGEAFSTKDQEEIDYLRGKPDDFKQVKGKRKK